MSEQPIAVSGSSKSSRDARKRHPVRSIFLGFLSLIAVIILLNLVVAGMNNNHPEEATPLVPATEAPTESTPTPEPTPSVTPTAALYDDCVAVWDALGRPVFKEDEGYRADFDWDSDGIGCEDNPSTSEDESSTDWASVRERFRENLDDIGNYVAPKAKSFWDQAKEFFDR